jgi:hypothetical protein
VCNVSHVQTSEPTVFGPSHLEVKIAIANFRKYKLPCMEKIPAELIQQEVKHYCLHSVIVFQTRKNSLVSERSLLLHPYIDEIIANHQCGF